MKLHQYLSKEKSLLCNPKSQFSIWWKGKSMMRRFTVNWFHEICFIAKQERYRHANFRQIRVKFLGKKSIWRNFCDKIVEVILSTSIYYLVLLNVRHFHHHHRLQIFPQIRPLLRYSLCMIITQCGKTKNSLSPKKFVKATTYVLTYLIISSVKTLLSRNFCQKVWEWISVISTLHSVEKWNI